MHAFWAFWGVRTPQRRGRRRDEGHKCVLNEINKCEI